MNDKRFHAIFICSALFLCTLVNGYGSIEFMGDKNNVVVIVSDLATNIETAKSLFSALSTGKLPAETDDSPIFTSEGRYLEVYCWEKDDEKGGKYASCLIGIKITDKTIISHDKPRQVQATLPKEVSEELYNKLLLKEFEKEGFKVKEFYSKDWNVKIVCYKNKKVSKPDVECLLDISETLK